MLTLFLLWNIFCFRISCNGGDHTALITLVVLSAAAAATVEKDLTLCDVIKIKGFQVYSRI